MPDHAANGSLRVIQAGCWIYFARGGGLVKIGFTRGWPAKRVANIQNGAPVPVYLVAVMPGTTKDEYDLHERFARSRSHGEWFRPTKELEGFIADVLKRCGQPDEESGVPAHILRLAEIEKQDDDDDRARLSELTTMRRQIRDYLARGSKPPAELWEAEIRLSSLLEAPVQNAR